MIDYLNTPVNSDAEYGLYVSAVGYENGFQVGDRIVGINGARVSTGSQIQNVINNHLVGDMVSVDVIRDGMKLKIGVILTEEDIYATANTHSA